MSECSFSGSVRSGIRSWTVSGTKKILAASDTEQKKSQWDMIHPGRAWEAKMSVPNRRSAEEILAAIEASVDERFPELE